MDMGTLCALVTEWESLRIVGLYSAMLETSVNGTWLVLWLGPERDPGFGNGNMSYSLNSLKGLSRRVF